MTLCVMCSLYAGIYRVALRLQRAADQRRTRMAASLVSAASHTITNITGLGVSRGSVVVPSLAAPLPPATSRPRDRADSCDGPTAVTAELHSNNPGDELPKLTSPDQHESFASNNDEEKQSGELQMLEEECDIDNATVSMTRRPASDCADKQQTEVTPLLEHPVDQRALNASEVTSASCTESSAKKTASKCRRRWLVVLPGDRGESFAASGARHRGEKPATVRHSIDVGRPLQYLGVRTSSNTPRRSLRETPIYSPVSVLATTGHSQSSSSSPSSCSSDDEPDDESRPQQRDAALEIVPASDELQDNALNDVIAASDVIVNK